VSFPPVIPPKKTHAFLTHTWRKDELGRDTHQRVGAVFEGLRRRGVITWFDEERMTGVIRHVMSEALQQTCCVVVFVTREYETKVNSNDLGDNCCYEFNIASNDRQLVNRRIPAVMDASMLNPGAWNRGRLQAELGGILSVDMTSENEVNFDRLARRIYETISQ
jgi:hypothetical protein